MKKVEGHSNLYRDEKSGAIINCDNQGYNQYVKSLKYRESKDKEIENLRKDIDLLHRIAKELLKYETVDSKDLEKILKGQRLTRRLNGIPSSRKNTKPRKRFKAKKSYKNNNIKNKNVNIDDQKEAIQKKSN